MNRNSEGVHLVPVGKVVRTHGVRGGLKIVAYGDTLGGLGAGEAVVWRSGAGKYPSRIFTVVQIRPQGRAWIALLEELSTLDEAQQFVGGELCLPEDRLPTLPDGEFYHYQLIGLTVETPQGRSLGVLRTILETGANDVYVIEDQGNEVLIPAVEEFVLEVDLISGRMIVSPPEGLIDDL